MKKNTKLSAFIIGRIDGKTFDSLAKELKISKNTLIAWNKECEVRKEIQEGVAFRRAEIVKQYQFDFKNRLEYKIGLLNKLRGELDQRDFSGLSDKDLLKITSNQDQEILNMLRYSTRIGNKISISEIGEDDDTFFDYSSTEH